VNKPSFDAAGDALLSGWWAGLGCPGAGTRQMAEPKKLGAWTPEEDETLQLLILHHGAKNWSEIALQIPGRSGKSCRLRWCNQLDPEVNKVHQTLGRRRSGDAMPPP
jgi:transcription factor MYB, plant